MVAFTLFELCVGYVTKNICLVESFKGFPDTIGQRIFQRVEATGQLDLKEPEMSRQILSLFTSAYATDILTDLNIDGDHLLLADCLDHLMLFSHIRALDISSCCLGDEHELLFHISTLKRLQTLVLRNNDLTDEGIRKLTAPVRVKKSGPLSLQTLDISGNTDVTVKSLKFLRVFSVLQLLNLSATAVQALHSPHTVPEVQEYARGRSLVVTTGALEESGIAARLGDMMEVKTKGWAANLVHTWSQDSGRRHQTTVTSANSNKARSFYGKSRSKALTHSWAAPSSSDKRKQGTSALSLVLIHRSLISHYSHSPSTATPLSEVCPIKPSNLAHPSQSCLSSSPSDLRRDVCRISVSSAVTQVPPQQSVPRGLCTQPSSPTTLPIVGQNSSAGSLSEVWQKGSGQHVTKKGLVEASVVDSRVQSSEKQQSANPSLAKSMHSTDYTGSQSSSSHTVHDPYQRLCTGQDPLDVLHVNNPNSLKRNVLLNSSDRTKSSYDAVYDLTSGCSEMQSASSAGHPNQEETCSHAELRRTRDKEFHCGDCCQRKKARMESDKGDHDELELLRQYGYSGI